MRIIADKDVPRFAIAKKMSMHQTGFQDVLAAAEMMGQSPREVVLIGVQPAELEDFGGGLTPLVAAQLEAVVQAAVQQLERWGFAPVVRTQPAESLLGPGLQRELYEGGRPSDTEACRAGDRRFFPAQREH
jgi:hydrogenase maturation protease